MSHFRSWRDDEDGRIGLVVLFGLLGGVIGVPLGALISSLLWDVVCRVDPPGSLDNRCGLEGLLFYLVGVPVGLWWASSSARSCDVVSVRKSLRKCDAFHCAPNVLSLASPT